MNNTNFISNKADIIFNLLLLVKVVVIKMCILYKYKADNKPNILNLRYEKIIKFAKNLTPLIKTKSKIFRKFQLFLALNVQ